MIGESIKRGRQGIAPRIATVVWQGTAEIGIPYGKFGRLPASLVVTDKGRDYAVVRLVGSALDRDRWWDARLFSTREWENGDGTLLPDVYPELASRVDAFFASAGQEHEFSARGLAERVRMGGFAYWDVGAQ